MLDKSAQLGLTLRDLTDGPPKGCTEDTRNRYKEAGENALKRIQNMLEQLEV